MTTEATTPQETNVPAPTTAVTLAASPDPILLYDGVCGLCAGVVQFTLRHDQRGKIRFAALQSRVAQEIFARHGQDATDLDTVAFVEHPGTPQEKLLLRSTAALALAGAMGGAWSALRIFRIVPRFLRDAAYDLVAKTRYRIFGKTDTCFLPKPEHRKRFLPED